MSPGSPACFRGWSHIAKCGDCLVNYPKFLMRSKISYICAGCYLETQLMAEDDHYKINKQNIVDGFCFSTTSRERTRTAMTRLPRKKLSHPIDRNTSARSARSWRPKRTRLLWPPARTATRAGPAGSRRASACRVPRPHAQSQRDVTAIPYDNAALDLINLDTKRFPLFPHGLWDRIGLQSRHVFDESDGCRPIYDMTISREHRSQPGPLFPLCDWDTLVGRNPQPDSGSQIW